jgi:hypothetical protein
MTITAIILSHYKERENNLKRIVDDLLAGTVKPDEIIIFKDNPEITYTDNRCTIIRSDRQFLPIIRFAIGSICNTDYCFFIDDDLTVRKHTLENFVQYADEDTILGLEGNILAEGDNPYTKGESINRGGRLVTVDIIIRTYFVPVSILAAAVLLRADHPELPKQSVDDIFLCLANKLGSNIVIPIDESSNMTELNEGGVGQSYAGNHYKNRDEVCRKLMYDSILY